jgi:DNA-binding NarL/FixJ family response regulator
VLHPIKVLVADESRAVRLLLTALLRDDARFEVVGDVASSAAVARHAEHVDLVVVNLALEGSDGFAVVEELRASAPHVATVIVAEVDPPYLRAEAETRGARGYFTHSMDPAELLDGFANAVGAAC